MFGLVAACWWGVWSTLAVLFEEYKLARRLLLLWVVWELSGVLSRTTTPEVLSSMTAPASTYLIAVVGLMTTVLGFYVKSRERDDSRP